jgi:hypothetical protein
MFTVFWIFEVPVYKGFRALGSERLGGHPFPADPHKSQCFWAFSAIYDPFGTQFSEQFT